ncbi:MAG: hypothetical protein ACREUA_03235 [Burkholderiales bacterium]
MQQLTVELHIPDDDGTVSLTGLMQVSGFSELDVRHFMAVGVLEPKGSEPWAFSSRCVTLMRTAARL